MEAHNFNILESRIKQAIDEIKHLKKVNAELQSQLSEQSDSPDQGEIGLNTGNKGKLLDKVDEMLEVLDQI